MNCKLRIIFACVFVTAMFFSAHLSAQKKNTRIDSLNTTLLHTTSDTERINILLELSSNSNDDTASKLKYVYDAMSLAQKIKWSKGISNANTQLGYYYTNRRHYDKALKYFQNNIQIAQSNHDGIDEIQSMELIAKCYDALGQHKKSLEYYYKILALNPDPDTKMGVYGDMGSIYTLIGDYTHALSSYVNSLKLLDEMLQSKKTGDIQDTLQKAGLLLNIGDIYLAMKQPDKAFENYNKVFAISKQIHDNTFETCLNPTPKPQNPLIMNKFKI